MIDLLLEMNFFEDFLILVSDRPKIEKLFFWINFNKHLNLVSSLRPLVLREAIWRFSGEGEELESFFGGFVRDILFASLFVLNKFVMCVCEFIVDLGGKRIEVRVRVEIHKLWSLGVI